MIDFDQGDSGGPLIATATRHSNSTQKRFIFKQTNHILAFYCQVFLGRHRELWCWLRWTRISRCERFLLNVEFLIFLHPGAYTRSSCFLSWLGEQFGFVLTKNSTSIATVMDLNHHHHHKEHHNHLNQRHHPQVDGRVELGRKVRLEHSLSGHQVEETKQQVAQIFNRKWWHFDD